MATIAQLKPKPPASNPWVHPNGHPTEAFGTFVQTVETLLKLLNGSGGMLLTDAVNDAAAAAAGVPIGAFYRNGSVVMIRVT